MNKAPTTTSKHELKNLNGNAGWVPPVQVEDELGFFVGIWFVLLTYGVCYVILKFEYLLGEMK